MAFRRLLTGPTLPRLEHEAFRTLSGSTGTQPESVLYIGETEQPEDEIRKRWKRYGSSACLRLDTFDNLVSDCYERGQYKGRVTNIDQPLLFRLIELGVEEIDSPTNPFHTGDRFPRAGLIDEARSIYTELEFAGLLTPEAMRKRLTEIGIGDRALHIGEVAEGVETAREIILTDGIRETYRTERMHHVTIMDTSLEELLPQIDAVILGGFTRFDALERDLLERIVETWPTIALLSKQNPSDDATGIDAAASRALETYRDLGFSIERHSDAPSSSIETRRRVVRNLYQHPENSPTIGNVDPTDLNLTYARSETVSDEIRDVARNLRSRLASGTAAEDVGVVLTSPSEYADRVQEVFESYNLPYSLQAEVPFTETALGQVVETICQLSREPRSIDSLLSLLTNPLVSVSDGRDSFNHHELSRVASRAETNRLDSVLAHVDDPVAATIESLLNDASALSDTELESLPGQLEALLEHLGVISTLTNGRELSQELRVRESSARERLQRVLETLVLTAPMADLDLGDCVDRLERALSGVSIRQPDHSLKQRVVVCGLGEARHHEFKHVYALGMTAAHFPSDLERMAFSRSIYESHPDFEQVDAGVEARYHFGELLVSTASIQLSAPQRSSKGEPYVEADVIIELRRIIEFSDITVEETDSEPGCREDVQWALGEAMAVTSESRVRGLIEEATEAGSIKSGQQIRMEAGIECAAARASPEITPYDGRLSTETISRVHAETVREPFSPSRLETYAACGFKYYMRRVLGIEAPDSLTREPDAGIRGSYIHDVFEHYYRSLQSDEGEPVHPGGDFEARQDRLLTVALERLEETFQEFPDTAFLDEWFTAVLAGLGTPSKNVYYGPEDESNDRRPIARGLFYRFLEHEFEEPAKTTARPALFEARIGNPYDAGTSIKDEPAIVETPHGPVPIHGLIDRVEIVPGRKPTQVVVRDYKTGNYVPSEQDALLGLNLQLPLYALMAEDALDDVETVGAAYYQVSPPTSVSSRKGLLTSQEMASYWDSDDVDTPLLRHSYPYFETHGAFRRFIEETTPERLGQLATGIAEGQFHPTLRDPSDAGCHYCDYVHVCDVRHHQRQDIIEVIEAAEDSTIVPPSARVDEIEELVEVN